MMTSYKGLEGWSKYESSYLCLVYIDCFYFGEPEYLSDWELWAVYQISGEGVVGYGDWSWICLIVLGISLFVQIWVLSNVFHE
jgi:hypothetical protein